MNANKRMKYASTPTYGMQKRGYSKASAAAQPAAAPDFTQIPTPNIPTIPMPSQQAAGGFMSASSIPMGMNGQPFMQPSSFLQTAPGLPMMSSMPMGPAQGMPMAGSSYMQPATPMSPAMPFAPLGNSPMVTQGQRTGFTPGQQGFVPPMTQGAPMASSAAPLQNNNPYTSGLDMFSTPMGVPLQNSGYRAASTQPQMPLSYMNPMMAPNPAIPMPGAADPATAPVTNLTQGQPMLSQQSTYSTPTTRSPEPMNVNRILSYFIFGALPLLFVPCLFVPAAWDFLRYIFIILCVAGVGLMWYRQMFAPSTRATITIVYAALCIVTVSLLLSGNQDTRATNAMTSDPPSQQTAAQEPQTPDPSAAALAAAQVDLVTPAPVSAPGESEAEVRLTEFMNYWSVNRIEDMVSLIQPSWAATKDYPATALFNLLANRSPEEFELETISGTDTDNSRTVTMTALINKNNGKDPVRYRFMVLMVKESGEWYVDPNSLATNDAVATPSDGATPTVGLATAAPRTTVTPVPPLDTPLYYNPSKGSFYHASQNCDSVNAEYLPLQGMFSYRDLKEKSKELKLQPCLKCGAPVNPPPTDVPADAPAEQ